jgi:excisionase family DNA binding protein
MAAAKKKPSKKPEAASAHEGQPDQPDQLDEVLATIKAGLTIPEVSKITGFHTETIRRWITAGSLKTFKVGNVLRVHRSDLTEFLQAKVATK